MTAHPSDLTGDLPDGLENRSLDRGIRILKTLARDGACSLADLHKSTSLPKSTLRRLLATLCRHNLVRHGVSDRRYRSNVGLPIGGDSEITTRTGQLVRAALPHMEELTELVVWPVDLHIRDGVRMKLIESTRAHSPFYVYKGILDIHVNMFGSAAGRALLAAQTDERIQLLVKEASAEARWSMERFYPDEATFMKAIALVRSQGYGTRRRGYNGESVGDDRLAAIATPVCKGQETLGALCVVFSRRLMSEAAFAELHLRQLKDAASAIGHALTTSDS